MNDVRPPLHPSVAAIRLAVRDALRPFAAADRAGEPGAGEPGAGEPGAGERGTEVTGEPSVASPHAAPSGAAPPRADVLVALSGGADSLALASAVAFEAPKQGLRAGAVIIDHGLQDRSAEVAAAASEQARALGLDPVLVIAVEVGTAGAGGPEAAARDARYAAIERARARTGASAVLLGHTLDDQAESVLLGLARGSGAASLQGMAAASGTLLRPLLGIRRSETAAACAAQGLEPWQDPHNADHRYTRVRVRETVLPAFEAELGPGIAEALARTAEALREDNDAFGAMIEEMIEEIVEHAEAGIAVSAAALAANPAALRQRIIRYIVDSEFGVSLTRLQTLEVARLVTHWHGQGPIDLPGCTAARENGLVVFSAR